MEAYRGLLHDKHFHCADTSSHHCPGCPLTLKRGNDGQPPWFEHDQMTVAAKILLRCTWLDPAEKEARRLHLQGMICLGLYGEGEKVVLCDV